MTKPMLIQAIPNQAINEMASYGPFDLKAFIQTDDIFSLHFTGELKDGHALPPGMILTSDGILTGIPARGTQGLYEIKVTIASGQEAITAFFLLTIQPSFASQEADYVDKLKSQIWDALEKNLPIPELGSLLSLPITKLDVYYLLERWGTLTIWDAFNLDPPSEKIALQLEGMSSHYHIYDRGSSLIMAPKELFSSERSLNDGIATAKALAREIYKRGWTIEMAGLDKWTRTAWIELQTLGDQNGKHLEIINYHPSPEELRAYTVTSWTTSPRVPD